MKSWFITSFLIVFFSAASLHAFAQPNRDHGKADKVSKPKPVRFIEGIEIKRDETVPVTEPVPQPVEPVSTVVPTGNIEHSFHLQFKYAQLLNCNVEAITNASLYNFIEDWWETPYRYGGTTKSGIDCSAFAGTVFTTVFKKDLPRTARDQYAACEKIERNSLQEGDLVFFNTRGGVSHVGVYLAEGYFVHASTSYGVTISNLDDDYYSARFLGGGRMTGNISDATANTGTR